jgi:thymidylate kinase
MSIFVRTLEINNIKYCILRNYESFPKTRDARSDIDILVCRNRLNDVITILENKVAQEDSWIVTRIRRSGLTTSFYIASQNGPALHIDLLCQISWHQYPWTDYKLILQQARTNGQCFVPTPGHEAAVSLLTYLFHRGEVKHEYRDRLQAMTITDPKGFSQVISSIGNNFMSAEALHFVANRSWQELALWGARARQAIRREAWQRRPFAVFGTTVKRYSDVLNRLLHPPGIMIALVGPDGCGKSTTAEGLAESLASLYPREKSVHLHWRPNLLPSPADLVRKIKRKNLSISLPDSTNPHGAVPYSTTLSLVRLIYFWLDFMIGIPFSIRPLTARNGLVLIDRYYYDFFVDQKRYRLKLPEFIVRIGSAFVPKPDIVFYLAAPPDVLLVRKQELSKEEIERQQAIITKLLPSWGKRSYTVDVSRSPVYVVDEIRSYVFSYLAEREQRRRKV